MKTRECGSVEVVVPVYNEVAVLPLLWERLSGVFPGLKCACRVLFVDDGSTDGSLALLLDLQKTDERIAVIGLSRNFGHQMAITAGMDYSTADAVVVIDADLQDPPELIKDMVEEYNKGFDVVYARRASRSGETLLKKLTAAAFYRIMTMVAGRRFPEGVGDYRLMSRKVADAVSHMRECHRFVRGMVAWVGFNQKELLFDREERAAGSTKYGYLKMLAFAWSAITSFSAMPVRLGFVIGLILLGISGIYGAWIVYAWIFLDGVVQGWTTLVLLQTFSAGLTLFYTGLIGDYVGRIYEQSKNRPLYMVKTTVGFRERA